MALADIFRPKYKHSKSAVRAAAVAAMSKDDIDLLVEVASADVDASIRRSAIAKLSDPNALAKVAKKQEDGKLRDYATGLAVDIWVATAIASKNLAEAKDSFNHAASYGGDRALAEIAGQAQLAEVRTQALARLEDDRALALFVRQSQRAEDWKDAITRIDDAEILRGIAIDDRRKEVAFAALDRIEEAEILDEVAAKAKNKSVRAKAKRLRAALAASDAADGGRSDEEKRITAERAQLARQVKDAADGDEWVHSRHTVDACVARWDELGSCENAKLTKRFDKARARYENAYQSHGKVAADELLRQEREAAAQEAAEARRLAQAAQASDAAADEPASSDAGDTAAAAADAEVKAPAPAPTESQNARDQDQRLDNQDELERICESLEELAEGQQIKGFDKLLKDTDRARRKVGPLPASASDALRDRYDEARRKAVIRLGELREADDWKRWSTVPKMEALVLRAKELLADTEASKVGEALKTLQKEWKELGAAPREKGDELWKIFKATCDEVYERVKAERETRNAEQGENLAKKEALCERAEALQSSTDWQETGVIFKELQAEWKNIGPVPRRKSDGIWKRFRTACDAFFEARAPHLEEQQSELDDNLEAKREIIREVEAIAVAEGEVEEQLAAVRTLQRKWRDVGKVAHRFFAEINDSYKVACDKVYAKRTELEEAAKAAELLLIAKMEEDIVECADAGWDSDASDIAKKVLDIRARYQQLDPAIAGYVELGPKIDSLIRSQLESEPDAYNGSVLDLGKSKAAYEALIAEADELAPEEVPEAETGDSEQMAERLRQALADRALGGVLSKSAGPSAVDRIAEIRAKWALVGPVPGAAGAALEERFAASCALALAGHQDAAPDAAEE